MVKKVFLDSNIWLRYLLLDNDQSTACVNVIMAIEAGYITGYTSTIVLTEVIYVLTAVYKVGRHQALSDIKTLSQIRSLRIIEKTDFLSAVMLSEKTNVKFSDCLIATQLPKGATLCTYDSDFAKMKQVTNQTAEEVMASLTLS